MSLPPVMTAPLLAPLHDELIRLLRSDPRTLALPLMMFSGTASTEVAREARHAGAADFLPKPLDPLLLEERVLALVGKTVTEGA